MLRALLSSKNNPPNKCRRAKNVLNINIQNNYHAVRSLNRTPPNSHRLGAWTSRPCQPSRARCPKTVVKKPSA